MAPQGRAATDITALSPHAAAAPPLAVVNTQKKLEKAQKTTSKAFDQAHLALIHTSEQHTRDKYTQ